MTTKAGQLLLMSGLTFHSGRRLADHPELLAAIEAEAIAAERARIEERLTVLYPANRTAVALVVDEAVDRSGAMLGRIRDATLGVKP